MMSGGKKENLEWTKCVSRLALFVSSVYEKEKKIGRRFVFIVSGNSE